MSDVMLLGVLRMPIEYVGGPMSPMAQLVSRAREAADRIESDAAEIERLRAQVAACAPAPAPAEAVAWRVQLDGLWFHAKDRDGLIAAIGVKLGRSVAAKYMQPLYTAPAAPAGCRATAEDMYALIGHAEALRMEGKTDMPAYLLDLAARIAPDAEHARRVREIAAAPSAPAAPAGWQPIETAPLGVWLLTARQGERGANITRATETGADDLEWADREGRTTVTHSTFLAPSHWMALPAAPGAQGDAS